jgi:hypothetical protein
LAGLSEYGLGFWLGGLGWWRDFWSWASWVAAFVDSQLSVTALPRRRIIRVRDLSGSAAWLRASRAWKAGQLPTIFALAARLLDRPGIRTSVRRDAKSEHFDWVDLPKSDAMVLASCSRKRDTRTVETAVDAAAFLLSPTSKKKTLLRGVDGKREWRAYFGGSPSAHGFKSFEGLSVEPPRSGQH